MTAPRSSSRTRRAVSWIAVAFLAVWIGGTVLMISTGGERGAGDRAALTERATAALRDGDGERLHELLLDAPDRDFAEDYAARLRAAGTPAVTATGPGTAEVRSGALHVTLSITEDDGRWYLSLLPPATAGELGE